MNRCSGPTNYSFNINSHFLPNSKNNSDCRLLIAYDVINNISFLIDTGSSYSLISASKCDRKKEADSTVLYSATSNVIQTFGTKTLKVNFDTVVDYEWSFVKTDLNFSIIGLDFLNFYQLIVDINNRRLIDTKNDFVINLEPCYGKPPKISCVMPKQSKFHDILSKYPTVVNPISRMMRQQVNVEHAIVTNGDIVKSKLRRTSPEMQKVIDDQINEWLKDGVISRSSSSFASCLLVIPKKSGKHRVCVDYRRLNAISLLEAYPIPPIHTLLDNLHGSRVFSVIDLKSAYHNVPIRAADRHKTAFITKSGCYEFNYMPFGLKSAPATFMRFIHEVLYSTSPELKNNTEVYLDDILIHTKDIESHQKIFEKVCQNLSRYNLTIGLSKCIFAKEKLNYLGFEISAEGYSATDEKIKAILEFPLPKTLRSLSRFCGAINFYHKTIEKCSELLHPLYNILNSNQKRPKSTVIQWSDQQRQHFEKVKCVLGKKTVLAYPIPFAETFLATDASDTCIAATLYQFDANKNERVPIAFYSKKLNKAQLNYAIFDKEVLAMYESIKHFRYMLDGRHFTILCDNQAAVQSLVKKNSANFSARILRQLQYISQFSTDCQFIASGENVVADALTRANVALISDLPEALDFESIASAQKSDADVQSLLNKITSLQIKEFPIRNSSSTILCDVSQTAPRVLLPKDFRRKAFDIIHSLNHAGIKSSRYLIKQRYYWPNMNKDIKDWVLQCSNCQLVKSKPHTKAPYASYPIATEVLSELNVDLIGPLPESRGHRYIFTICDRFTKACFAFALPDTKSDTIATYFLNHYVAIFGLPKVIITDNASYFTSYSWTKFMSFLGVHHKFITPYHCQSNGLVERFNRYLRTALRCHDNNTSWFDHLGLCLLGIQASFHSPLKMSRAELLFGKKLRLPSSFFDETVNRPSFDDPALTKSLMTYFNNRKPAPINTEKNNANFRINNKLFSCPAVYLRVDRVKKGLENSFTGPFKVLERFDKYFIIETSKGSSKISIDRLKPAYSTDFVETCDRSNTRSSDFLLKPKPANSSLSVTNETQPQSLANNLSSADANNATRSISFDSVPEQRTTRSGRIITPPSRYLS